MKKALFLILAAIISNMAVFAQLPGQAQVLYDSVYVQDPVLVNTALTHGAQIFSTPDSNSFYLQWFPVGAIPSASPLIVSLHGSESNAFMEFKSWYPQAQLHGCGIIAIQWYRYKPKPPFDYFPDDTLYSYISSALANISYPSGRALLHGFSRGAARSYAMIFNDIQSGNNYFCTTISNAGYLDLGYPLYDSINSGVYGHNFFSGKHWNLFCGPPEPPISGGACDGMNFTQTWLQNQGAIIDIYIQDPLLGHNGFQKPYSFAYKDTMLNKYLECYNGTSSVYENLEENKLDISPNPFSSQAILQTATPFKNISLVFYDSFGQVVKQMDKLAEETIVLHRDNLPAGLYLVRLTQDNQTITTKKVIIID